MLGDPETCRRENRSPFKLLASGDVTACLVPCGPAADVHIRVSVLPIPGTLNLGLAALIEARIEAPAELRELWVVAGLADPNFPTDVRVGVRHGGCLMHPTGQGRLCCRDQGLRLGCKDSQCYRQGDREGRQPRAPPGCHDGEGGLKAAAFGSLEVVLHEDSRCFLFSLLSRSLALLT